MHPALLALSPLLAAPLLAVFQDGPQDDPAQTRQQVQDYWRDVAESLAEHRSVEQILPADPVDSALRERLRATRVEGLRCRNEESLQALLDIVTSLNDLPIVLDPRAEQACIDEGVVFNLDWEHPVPAVTALDTLCQLAGDEVEWTVHEGVVLVTVVERRRELDLFLHPIGDLVTLFDADELACLVLDHIAAPSWDWDGVSLEVTGPFLPITHTRETHLAIERFLGDLRAFKASRDSAPSFAPTAQELEYDALLGRLEAVRVLPRFDGAHIEEIASFLQQVTGTNFMVSNSVREYLSEEEVTISLDLEERDVRSLLDLIVEIRPSLAWALVDGVVHVQTAEEPRLDRTLAMYDVRAIVDPAAPEFALRANFESSEDVYEAQVLDADFLSELIFTTVAPESWDRDPANSLIVFPSGVLIVRQSVEAQSEIRAFVADLSAIADVMMKAQDDRRRDR